jgi:fumarate reductase subunit D
MHWWQFSFAPFMKILAFATKRQCLRKVAIFAVLLLLSGSSIFSLHAGAGFTILGIDYDVCNIFCYTLRALTTVVAVSSNYPHRPQD